MKNLISILKPRVYRNWEIGDKLYDSVGILIALGRWELGFLFQNISHKPRRLHVRVSLIWWVLCWLGR